MKTLVLLLLSFNAFAGTETITFTAPTEREDGSALSVAQIDYYEAYFYQGGLQHTETVAGTATSFTLTLPDMSYAVVMRTFDKSENKSEPSNQVIVKFKSPSPLPPVIQ